jgi:hypothetical protein
MNLSNERPDPRREEILDDTGLSKDARRARLEEQERHWLLWLSRLHEHHEKVGTDETRIVLEIAKRRWLAAKTALDEHIAGG